MRLYHGTPLTPVSALMELRGRCFCVPFPRPEAARRCHVIGAGVMLDNGAFSAWRRGISPDWPRYYTWVERWLEHPTTWAVIPDVVEAGAEVQDALLNQWPHGHRGAPVWHMHEPIGRLLRLIEAWPRVCVGSSAQYARVMAPDWQRRMDEAWSAIAATFGEVPDMHMLRGLQLAGNRWPFTSADSTDVARNHHLPQHTPLSMVLRWEARAAGTAKAFAA